MGNKRRIFLNSDKVYACFKCYSHLSTLNDIISKNFHSTSGKAYLFDQVYNVVVAEKQERMLRTGRHVIANLYCECGEYVGWKYFVAYEEDQKYKIGKCVLEKAKLFTIREDELSTDSTCSSISTSISTSTSRSASISSRSSNETIYC